MKCENCFKPVLLGFDIYKPVSSDCYAGIVEPPVRKFSYCMVCYQKVLKSGKLQLRY